MGTEQNKYSGVFGMLEKHSNHLACAEKREISFKMGVTMEQCNTFSAAAPSINGQARIIS